MHELVRIVCHSLLSFPFVASYKVPFVQLRDNYIVRSHISLSKKLFSSGSNVCGECSRRKFLIPYVNPNKESRVCNDCYFFLVSGADALVENSVSTAAVSATNRNSVATSPRYRVSMSSTNDLSVDRDDLNSPFDLDRFLQIKQDVSEDLENRNSAHNNNSYNGSSKPLSSRIKIPSIRFKAGTLSISTDLSPISTPNNSGKKCQVCSCEFSVFKPKQICKNW